MNADDWYAKGEMLEINGFQHFVYDSKNGKPYLLVLHGYPTCSYDFHKTLPMIEAHFCVVIHDHLGFGYSDKPLDYSYSLFKQTDQALLLWQQLGIREAVVLAHDYGTSIATEIVARRTESNDLGIDILQLVLCNGSMHVELAQLRLIQKLLLNRITGPWVAQFSSRRILAKNLQQLYWDPNKVSNQEIDALYKMMTFNNGRRVLHKTTQYIRQRYTYWNRWIGGLRSTDLAIHIVWAKNDPVAVYPMAVTLHQEIRLSYLTVLENLGHFPMLEAPERWATAVIASLSSD